MDSPPPRRHNLTLQERPYRSALALAGNRQTGQVQQGGHHVNVLGEVVDHHPGRTVEGRVADDQRDVEGLVVEAHFGHQAVVAEHLPVVGGDGHHRVLGPPAVIEVPEQPADLIVDLLHHAVVGGPQLAPVQFRIRCPGEPPLGNPVHERVAGGSGRQRVRNLSRVVAVVIGGGDHERRVWSHDRHVYVPRFGKAVEGVADLADQEGRFGLVAGIGRRCPGGPAAGWHF